MTPIDDLSPGLWIAVVGDKDDRRPTDCIVVQTQFNGLPLQIKAIDLPFVCVQSASGGVCALDVRRFEVQKLSEEYVRAMCQPTPQTIQAFVGGWGK